MAKKKVVRRRIVRREPRRVSAGDAQPTQYHLVLFQTGNQRHPFSSMTRDLVRHVQKLMDQEIDTPPEMTHVDVWIESPGGDANAAYKLYLDLRSRASFIRAIIPDYAKSAATLFALGVDEIWMSASAELGPLDAQIEHPEREHFTVSALEVAFSLDYLARFATYYIGRDAGPKMIDWTRLSRIEILRELCNFTAQLLEPAISKLDPTLIHRATKQLKVAQRYAELMLLGRNRPEEEKNERYVESLVDHLINDYPAHGFVVSREEAESLSLPIRRLEAHPRVQAVRDKHEAFEQIAAEGEVSALVEFFRDARIDQSEEVEADGQEATEDESRI